MGTLAVAVCIMYVIESRSALLEDQSDSDLSPRRGPRGILVAGCRALCRRLAGTANTRQGARCFLWFAGTAGLTLINGNGWAWASFVVLAGMASGITIEIPRASRFFYLYYPAHLAVFLLLGFRIQSP